MCSEYPLTLISYLVPAFFFPSFFFTGMTMPSSNRKVSRGITDNRARNYTSVGRISPL